MIHIPMLVLALNRLAGSGWREAFRPRSLRSLRSLQILIPVGVVAAIALAFFFLPYVRVAKAQSLGLLLLIALAGYVRVTGQTLAREVPGSHPHLQIAYWQRPAEMIAIPLLLWFALRRGWKAGRLLRLADVDPWERGLLFSGLAC